LTPAAGSPALASSQERARQLTLPELLRRRARTAPHATALCLDGETRSYAELDARADRLAAALARREVAPGDTVAVWMHNGIEMIEALFAIHKRGAAAVPLNFRLTAPEVAFILADSAACGLLADRRLIDAIGRPPSTEWQLVVSGGGDDSYEEAIAEGGDGPDSPPIDDDDAAFVMYTSGTTGQPKGAVLTHKNLIANTWNWTFAVGISEGDVYSAGLPLFHIGGLVGLYPFLLLGNRVVLQRTGGFDPAAALDLMDRAQSTVCAYVPTQWQLLVDEPGAAAVFGRQRRAIWGASPASRPLLERMMEALPEDSVVGTFGQTEVTANATFLAPRDARRKLGSVGRPAMTMEHRIVDDDDRDVPTGEIGEIVYRGPTVTPGYFRRPEATREAFRGGWFHSGDLVREDPDGYLYVVDRKSDTIISGGENIYPAEVERVLVEHPAVAEVAVVGVADARWGETPVAYVVGAAGASPAAQALIDFCGPRLARFKHPSRVVLIDELPRNASGKVLRRVLRERATDQGENV
jgi:acyl-CoA synthetase (AMP-forming)/AMP-acid ligase II